MENIFRITFVFLCVIALTRSQDYPREVVKVLTVENGGKWGDWHSPQFCGKGTFATGYSMKIEGKQNKLGLNKDDTALNAVLLRCGGRYPGLLSEEISSGQGPWGDWTAYADCASRDGMQDFITGFRLEVEESQGLGDDTAANLIEVHCRHGVHGTVYDIEAPAKGVWGMFGKWSENCPQDSAVCGIQTKVEPEQGTFKDDTTLNDVKLFCCKLNAVQKAVVKLFKEN